MAPCAHGGHRTSLPTARTAPLTARPRTRPTAASRPSRHPTPAARKLPTSPHTPVRDAARARARRLPAVRLRGPLLEGVRHPRAGVPHGDHEPVGLHGADAQGVRAGGVGVGVGEQLCAQGEACVHISATPQTIHLTESADPTQAILSATPTAFGALLRTLKTSPKRG
ncbi:DUF397 domain-containing protein [Streptomyces sp. YC419]|uniref:DUF397 domain-containing protein n=1 Tax=Streptomyces ureilyticus TaxID=1775131 RepID=A0ABX0DUX0_9ACTN|nr:DUF397 domain-containing protein [Streptomyces ureilyticus]